MKARMGTAPVRTRKVGVATCMSTDSGIAPSTLPPLSLRPSFGLLR